VHSLCSMTRASAKMFERAGDNPIAQGVGGFLSEEADHAWSKAYFIADKRKALRPDELEIRGFANALFECSIAMGNSLSDAVAVVTEI
jgi:hypothetical protein